VWPLIAAALRDEKREDDYPHTYPHNGACADVLRELSKVNAAAVLDEVGAPLVVKFMVMDENLNYDDICADLCLVLFNLA
jgi:hypothetical protein